MAGAGVTIPPLQDYHNSSFVHPCLLPLPDGSKVYRYGEEKVSNLRYKLRAFPFGIRLLASPA